MGGLFGGERRSERSRRFLADQRVCGEFFHLGQQYFGAQHSSIGHLERRGTDNNWSTKPDWDFLPTNDDDLTFAGTTRLSPSNDSLSRVGFITFSNTAGAFTLSGNAVTIAGGITNNSTNTQTIGLNLTLSVAQQFNAASGTWRLTARSTTVAMF